MGSWDETCALSNIGIHEGERVVMVLMTTDPKQNYPDDYQFGLFYDSYAITRVTHIIRGEYDDYGGVEGAEDAYGPSVRYKLMFREDVWDWAVNQFNFFSEQDIKYFNKYIQDTKDKFTRYPQIYRPCIDGFEDVLKVAKLAVILRKPLLSLVPSGPQFTSDSVEWQLRFLDFIRPLIEAQRSSEDDE